MSKLQSIVDGSRAPGIYRFASRASAKQVRSQLEAEGWRVFCLEGHDIKDKASFLSECAVSMEFPAYFGKNWDAFEECLTDLSWAKADGYVVLFDHADAFELNAADDWATAMEIFGNALKSWHEAGTSMIVLVRGAKAALPTL